MYSPTHMWTDQDFAELAKPATTPLPVGTVITTQKLATVSGLHDHGDANGVPRRSLLLKFFPAQKVIAGPTIPVPLPKLFQAATEKYAGTASIVPALEIGPGAVTIKGYQGGVPFPDPKEPDLGTKIEYNSWFSYAPATVHINADAYLVDRFHDRPLNRGRGGWKNPRSLPIRAIPETNPLLADIFKYTYDEVVLPEEAKYSGVWICGNTIRSSSPTSSLMFLRCAACCGFHRRRCVHRS